MRNSLFLLNFDETKEIAFQSAVLKQSISYLRGAILFSILLFILFGWLDRYIVVDDYWSIWVFRLIYCSYATIILIYSYTVFFESLHQLVMGSLVVVGAICLLGIMIIPIEYEMSNAYYAAFILLIFFNFTLTNLKFWYALVLGFLIILFYFFTSIFYSKVLLYGWLSKEGTIFINNLFFLIMSFFMGTVICLIIESYRRRDFLQQNELQNEQEKSKDLLLNILPATIAERLMQSSNTIADEHPSVSILFADLVGFTKLASEMPPKNVVNMLDAIFSKFDYLAEKFQLEKIKTIGDAYMIAGGLTGEKSIAHLIGMADMALSMQREIQKYNRKFGTTLKLRIGIHLGPVVAGVIGANKFTYDMWGDTVNIASRLESTSIDGEIQVSKEVYEVVKDKFLLFPRGDIQMKGKGSLSTYLLKG